MIEYKEMVHKYVNEHKSEIVDTLKELVKIPSVRSKADAGAPFGKACADVLEYTKELYSKNGFETMLDTEGGYLLAFTGEGDKSIGLFSHADVVPVADDWLLTNPFEPLEKEGCLIGRGVVDDKSAIVISLYCAKMLKELKIPFNSRLVCFTGANEESGMADIKNYVKKHTPPDFSLVCDTDFPLYRGNKGMLLFSAVSDIPLNDIKNISGSNALGSILGSVSITVSYDEMLLSELKKFENDQFVITTENEDIVITAKGISSHTALPEGSLNAAGVAFSVLSECKHWNKNNLMQISYLSDILTHYYGETIGIQNSDKDFGRLTICNDTIGLENSKIKLHFNLRFGAEVDVDTLKLTIKDAFKKHSFNVNFEREEPAVITDLNNPMLKAVLETYRLFFEEPDAEPYVNAGGTYARYLPCAVETGTRHWKDKPLSLPIGHGGVHQPDECLNIEAFLKALEVTLHMLLSCDKEEI